jgi:hypothetical protein
MLGLLLIGRGFNNTEDSSRTKNDGPAPSEWPVFGGVEPPENRHREKLPVAGAIGGDSFLVLAI